MLLQFSVKNFRSIKDWATLSMIPLGRLDKYDGNMSSIFKLPWNDDISILKAGVIYGKNASGKSNILLAIRAIAYMIKNADLYDESQAVPPYEPFLFEDNTVEMPCSMEVDFIGENGFKYNYFISYTKNHIESEKLTFYPKKQPALLFNRIHSVDSSKPIIEFGPQFKGDRRFLKDKNIDNKLLLSEFKGIEYHNTREAFLFFSNIILTTTRTEKGSSDTYDVINLNSIIRTLGRLKQSDENGYKDFITKIVSILKGADTGIVGLEVNKVESISGTEEFEKESYQVYTHHANFENGKKSGIKKISIFSESTGTIKLFGLLNSILSGFGRGSLVALDELDRSLHPRLTRLIIGMFINLKEETYASIKPHSFPQLLFTTHDSSLLDKDLFRRDQIWFTDTDESLSTILYCLADIKGVRKDTPYSDWYLSGRFGGVPAISKMEVI